MESAVILNLPFSFPSWEFLFLCSDLSEFFLEVSSDAIELLLHQGQPLFRDMMPFSEWMPWDAFKAKREQIEAMHADTDGW